MKIRTLLLSLTALFAVMTWNVLGAEATAAAPEGLKPLGEGKGIHPGRVVWVRDPAVLDWKGPGDGHWWEASHTHQDRANAMMARAVCELTGEATVPRAWDALFRHLNRVRGKGEAGYRAGERVLIKPNSVGFDFLWTEFPDVPRRPGVDDYLHEAALAGQPPSGTFYDPNHATPVKRLGSLGVHEHWNNAQEKKYSRNLGRPEGIELIQVAAGASTD